MEKKKKNKYEEPIKLDEDLTFEEAMKRIAKAKKEDVERSEKESQDPDDEEENEVDKDVD